MRHKGSSDLLHQGIAASKAGPLLVASHPIIPSDEPGPVRGTLLFVRRLDESRMSKQARLGEDQHLEITPGAAMQAALRQHALLGQARTGQLLIERLGPTQLEAHHSLLDLRSRPVALLTLDSPRPLYARAESASRRVLLLVLLGGCCLFLSVLLTQEQLVLKRLGRLNWRLQQIGASQDPAARMRVEGEDELGAVALNINGMLESLQTAQQERRETDDRFREMASLLPDILLETDEQFQIRYANHAAYENCRYTWRDVRRGLGLRDLLEEKGADDVMADLQDVARDAGPRIRTYQVRCKDGRVFPCEVHVAPIAGADGGFAGLRIVGRDISDRQEMERTERMAAIGQLSAGVAHEFNNLLCGLMGQAEIAAALHPSEASSSLADLIVERCERGANICRKLLRVSRPRPPSRQLVPIEQPLESALAVAERDLVNAEVEIERRYDTQGLQAFVDGAELEQVFLNLIINACHAMPAGGTLTITASHQQTQAGVGQLVVKIRDTGTGIAAADLTRIFEPFFTTKVGHCGGRTGTGLGLSVSLSIIQAHGGVIRARSTVGVGTEFEIRLAACVPQTALIPEEVNLMDANADSVSACKVLLAEDDEAIRQTLQSLLELKGYDVQIAQNTEETIARLREQDFNLIISDYLMPGGGGREVLRFLNEQGKHPAVIMITGLADEQLFGELMTQGVDRCLSKPFRLASLLTTIEDTMKGKAE